MDIRVTEFAAAEAKARFSELLERAEHGESLTIRRHGKAVAKLVPVKRNLTVEDRIRATEEWLAKRNGPDGPRLGPDLTIKQLINEGRKY